MGEQGKWGEKKSQSGEAKGTKQAGFQSRMFVEHFFFLEKHKQNLFEWQKESSHEH